MFNHILNFANEVARAYHAVPPGFWHALIASGVLSPLIKVWKHFRITKKEKEIGEVTMYLITFGVSFGAALVGYLLTKNPGSIRLVALHTAVISFTMTPVYLIGVKPAWKYLLKKFGKDAEEYANELKSAVIPAGGLPLAGTSVSANTSGSTDFTS